MLRGINSLIVILDVSFNDLVRKMPGKAFLSWRIFSTVPAALVKRPRHSGRKITTAIGKAKRPGAGGQKSMLEKAKRSSCLGGEKITTPRKRSDRWLGIKGACLKAATGSVLEEDHYAGGNEATEE